jgi:serine/threonine protein kinase
MTAPEYALDSSLTPASDLYSLGCVLFALHMGGKPPFQNRGSMSSLRENAEGPLVSKSWASGSKWERCSSEVKGRLPHDSTKTRLTSRLTPPSVDKTTKPANFHKVPSLTPILFFTRYQHPKFPRSYYIRLEATGGESDFPQGASEGLADILRSSEAKEDPA